jgi:mannose-1-phosphate guanylyltransferase
LIGVYNGQEAFHVLRFKEKPSEDQAQKMIVDGDHAWNSGMFVWKADRIMEEFRRQMPDLYTGLQEIAASWGGPDQQNVLKRVWPGLKSETIDYGIMEGASDVAVIPAAGLGWKMSAADLCSMSFPPTSREISPWVGNTGLDTAPLRQPEHRRSSPLSR